MTRKIDTIVVHCSATRPSLDVNVADIDRWHKRLGWGRIGYHYVITRAGALEVGRGEADVGAHVRGHNATSLGICLVGGVSEDGKNAENNFRSAQMTALAALLDELIRRYPGARICGHRDLSPDLDGDGVIERHEWLKECPCFDVGAWVKQHGVGGAEG